MLMYGMVCVLDWMDVDDVVVGEKEGTTKETFGDCVSLYPIAWCNIKRHIWWINQLHVGIQANRRYGKANSTRPSSSALIQMKWPLASYLLKGNEMWKRLASDEIKWITECSVGPSVLCESIYSLHVSICAHVSVISVSVWTIMCCVVCMRVCVWSGCERTGSRLNDEPGQHFTSPCSRLCSIWMLTQYALC